MSVGYYNNGVMHFTQNYTQCQCCGKYSEGFNTLCENCQRDAVDKNHRQELEKVYNFYRENKFAEIIEILKKCNHLTRTKMIYADCLFYSQAFDDLDIFLDNWVEESYIYNDLDGYYVFILRLKYLKRKHTMANEDIYKIIETPDRKMSNELWAQYYNFKAKEKFSPFTPQEYFELTNKALNYAINTQPLILGMSNRSNKFITYSKNGKPRSTYQIPVDFRLVGEIFFTAAQHYEKLRDYPNLYDVLKKALNLFLQDEWFIHAKNILQFYITQASLQSNFTEIIYSTDILKKLIDDTNLLSFEERKEAILSLLSTYDHFIMPQQGIDYLERIERKEEFKNALALNKGSFNFGLGEYAKAAEAYWFSFTEFTKEKNYMLAAHSYVFFKICRLLDHSIEPKLLDTEVKQALEDPNSPGPYYKAILSILENNLAGKYTEALAILDDKMFNNFNSLILKQILINERACCYYNLWMQNKKSREYYDLLLGTLNIGLDNTFISTPYLFSIRRKVQFILLLIIGEEKIDIANEIQDLKNVIKPLGFTKFLEFLEMLETAVANPKKIRKKLEENFPVYLRNINCLLRSKEF